jgi:hypothetical protein
MEGLDQLRLGRNGDPVTRRIRALIFLRMDLSEIHGTTIWARNFLQSIARVSNTDFVIVICAAAKAQTATQALLEGLGLELVYIPKLEPSKRWNNRLSHILSKAVAGALDILLEKYFFWGEQECRKQTHVEPTLVHVVNQQAPDVILMGHIGAAVQAPAVFRTPIPCCLICLNNEIALYRELKSQGGLESMGNFRLWIFRNFNWISNMRSRSFINEIYRRSSAIVALTQNDLPPDLPANIIRTVIPTVLDQSPYTWRYQATRFLLFVGNIFYGNARHFPNWQAIEWICTRLSPEIAQLDGSVKINVIGADAEQAPLDWHHPNVSFLGRSNTETLIHLLTSSDLFIAPIANSYGSKLKLAECVSHGTPFAATEGAMSGLSFLSTIPRIHLTQPRMAALTVLEYMNSPDKLRSLSNSVLAGARTARAEQDAAWSSILARTAQLAQSRSR